MVVPAYQSSSATSSTFGSVSVPALGPPTTSAPVVLTTSSRTMFQVNGTGALLVLAVPLLVVAAVALLLPRHRRLAWTATLLLLAGCLPAMLTVGPFVLPVAVLLVVACAQDAPAA